MSIGRVTQSMMSHSALAGLQTSLSRVSELQEKLSTGRIINRPSDDPIGAASAMRLRSSKAEQAQFSRNADDGVAWLNQIDGALGSAGDQLRRARDLAIQGANSGALGQQARDALATEVGQIRQGLVGVANTTYLNRPVFNGVDARTTAYDGSTQPVTWTGTTGDVVRRVGVGVDIKVNVNGPEAFGPENDTVFDHLDALTTALKAGKTDDISKAIGVLKADGDRISSARADVGTRTNRIELAKSQADDAGLTLSSSISEVENTDLAKATVDLQLQQVAYQAALAATAKVMQPSLQDFLR